MGLWQEALPFDHRCQRAVQLDPAGRPAQGRARALRPWTADVHPTAL